MSAESLEITNKELGRPRIVVAATFTAEPILGALGLLMREAGLGLDAAVAPYGQIFQELLDPSSGFGKNRNGVNVVLVRLEDWIRDAPEGAEATSNAETIKRNVEDLVSAVKQAAASLSSPIVLWVCPPSSGSSARLPAPDFLEGVAAHLESELVTVPNVRLLGKDWLGALSSDSVHDPQGDRLGHVPYTPLFFAALGTALARLVCALKNPPHKVIVLDCDNTLWRGVVGEDGIEGVEITARHRALQQFVLAKKNAGMIVCLASKNVEADILELFRERKDMVLRIEDIVSMRVNWLPKSENLRALAAELNLGLDSFVFIDDNPLECAEVEAGCPGVLAICLPVDGDFPTFVGNVWPLDQLDVTEEDRRRTEMYRQNLDRDRFQKSATSLADFLAGLDLRIDMGTPSAEQIPRVAQLTQRTNQFNFTTRRRTEGEIEQLIRGGAGGASGPECRRVEVRDRFGDYGLVGLMVFETEGDALSIDTMLLSCRVLGRGVEHAMMRELGGLARARGLSSVVASFIPTKKNLPARQFLDGLASEGREEAAQGTRYRFSAERLAALHPGDGAPVALPVEEAPQVANGVGGPALDEQKSARWNRLAREFDAPEKVLAALERANRRDRASAAPPASPRTAIERQLATIWADALGVAQVGIHDDYFDLGGTSLLAVAIFARIEREMGKRFALAILVECPTIAALAARFDPAVGTGSLVLLQEGGAEAPPVFLVHDADGETLLYRNLARRLGGRRAIYGIQPEGRADTPTVYTRVEDMAAHYVEAIRKVRPHGPYLLGGLCAGGVLAFEMALQIEAAQEEVRLVALFDAADVAAPPKPHLESRRKIQGLGQALRMAPMREAPGLLFSKAKGFLAYRIESRVRRQLDRVAVATLRFCLDNELPLPGWARNLPVRTVYLQAESEYRPRRVVRDEIVLFRATEGEGAEEPYVERYADPLLGWGPRTAAGVRAIDVPGGHGSMLQEPHVQAIAAVLRSDLGDDVLAAPVASRSTPGPGSERAVEPGGGGPTVVNHGSGERWTSPRSS